MDVLPFLEIIIKIGIFQFLWIALSLLGGFLFGVMPSTVGLFTVMRKWLMGNENLQSLVKAYWTTFRKEFWKANAIGFVLLFIGFLLYLNFSLIRFTHGFVHLGLLIFIATLSNLFFFLLLYIIPAYVHFEFKLQRYMIMSILVGISFPFHTIFLALGNYILFKFYLWVLGFIPFFSISVPALFTMWLSMKIFKTMESKVKETSNSEMSETNLLFRL
jgi:uncharacterized membrane protein YesL